MNFQLTRNRANLYGIFGVLESEDGAHKFYTLEHSYNNEPKVAVGTYKCVRHPPARLHYETFMLEGVPPFQGCAVDGILIHIGNYNNDSEGCILIGSLSASTCILESRAAFDVFMGLQKGVESFLLIVS